MTSRHDAMTCQSDVIFLEKWKLHLHIYMIGNYGKLNETWVVSLEQRNITMTSRDSWQYVITWHTWHMTSRHDFISIKLDIWLLLYVAVSELERWFDLCFARYLGKEIHSDYRGLRNLHAWPWNWRSRHGLRDLLLSLLVFVLPQWFFVSLRFL